jgi:hypothetical protein
MIAVASLALAQRDGRQRPIHQTERLELGSTIVQLQRARTTKPSVGSAGEDAQDKKLDSKVLSEGSSNVDAKNDMPSRHMSRSERVSSVKAFLPSPGQKDKSTTLSSKRTHGISLPSTRISLANVSLACLSGTQLQKQETPSMPDPAVEVGVTTRVNPKLRPGAMALPRRQTAHILGSLRESHPLDQSLPQGPMPSTPSFEATALTQPHEEQPPETTPLNTLMATPSTASTSDEVCYYQGWTTDHLQGLRTGYGDSLLLSQMKLPERSLATLVKTYAHEGHDPYISMINLTKEQQTIIEETCSEHSGAELVYIRLGRNVAVSSVFGTLNIQTLEWIIASKVRWPGAPARYGPVSPIHQYGRSSADMTLEDSFPSQSSRTQAAPILTHSSPSASTPRLNEMKSASSRFINMTSARRRDSSYSAFQHGRSIDAPTPMEAEANDDDSSQESSSPASTPEEAYFVPEYSSAGHEPNLPTEGTKFTRPKRTASGAPIQRHSEIVPHPTYEQRPQRRRYARLGEGVPSQPPEKTEEEIVNELLARWTVS